MRILIGRALVLTAGAIVLLLGLAQAAHPSGNTYAIDLDPATPGIQSSIAVPIGSNFTVVTVITAAPDAYSAHQAYVKFDPQVVKYVSGPVEHILGGANICPGGNVPSGEISYLWDGCASARGVQSDIGPTFEWTMTCLAQGVTAFRFQSSAEAGQGLGTNFALDITDNQGLGDPVLQDASVTCGAGTPVPTFTPRPAITSDVPPTATPTPVGGVPTSAAEATEATEAKTPGSPAQATVTARSVAAVTAVAVKTLIGAAQATTTAQSGDIAPGATMTAEAASVSSNGSSGGSSHKGLIIGLVIAGVAVVAAAVGGGAWYWMGRQAGP